MKYPKLRELREAMRALVKGPYTSKFPYKEHLPPPTFRGKPIPNQDECVGCGACKEICPAVAIEIIDDIHSKPPLRHLIWHYDLCIQCAQCERNCVTKNGVKLSSIEYDLSTLDRKTLATEIKKELVLCQICQTVISTKDHIIWMAKKIQNMVYGNYLAFTFLNESLGLAKLPTPTFYPPVSRQNMFKITCPKCRREALLFDEYGTIP